MKNLLISLFAIIIISNLHAQTIFTSDYIALTVPQHYTGEIWYLNDNFNQEVKDVRDVKNDNSILKSFPNVVSNVTVYQVEQSGELKVAGVGISGKNEVYHVIYDFSQTQTLIFYDKNVPESALVGVGVRMVAKVKTKKAGINIASPFGLVANAKKIEGSLEVRVTGISSAKINGLIPTTTDLSPSSISVALQAVATIKSHIYDEETVITPQYLAYNRRDSSVSVQNLKVNKELRK